jgi:hypothetical protein
MDRYENCIEKCRGKNRTELGSLGRLMCSMKDDIKMDL